MKIMKKTTYLIIISIITIVCVIAGSIYHIGGFRIPGFSNKSDTKFTSIELDDGSVSADTVNLDKFSDIDMDLQVMDVTIQKGDSLGISYECSKKEYVPTIDVKDDVLTVKQKVKNKINIGNVKRCKMILTVPDDIDIENIEISTDVGDIKIDDVNGDAFTLESDVGDMKLAGITGEELSINTDVGDVKLEECSFDNAEISGHTGDVKVEGVDDLSKYTMDFETDLGDVKVNGKNYKKQYSEKASSGDSEKEQSLTISTNIGDIVVD